jgi:hypothetical protein
MSDGTVTDGKNPPAEPKPFPGANRWPVFIIPKTFSFEIKNKSIRIEKGTCIPALEISEEKAMEPGASVEFDVKWQKVSGKQLLVAYNVILKK